MNANGNALTVTTTGFSIRVGQCLFAAASIGVMASASGFSTTPAFRYLIALMMVQFLWSLVIIAFYIRASPLFGQLSVPKGAMRLLLLVDWVIAPLSLAGACSSAGVMIFYTKDTNICSMETKLSCGMFEISIAFAFVSWFLLYVSSRMDFWVLAVF